MLTYMPRLVRTYRLPLWSVVLYVGRGAGARDSGSHQVEGPDGTPILTWRYHPIRLWEMPAEELLRLDRPALLALVGQTQIHEPAAVLPEVVQRLHQVPDVEKRRRLLTALTALLTDEEMITMVENLLERDELLLDTPFLCRLREEGQREGRQEGRQEGHEAGRQEGHWAGLQEGQTVGLLAARRRSILDVLVARLDPPASVYQQVERQLAQITDEESLTRLLVAIARAENVAAVQTALGPAGRTTLPG